MTATTPVRSRRPSRLWITLTALVVLIAGVSIAATAVAASGPKPTVKALGADVVKLSWAAITGATKYTVRYLTSSSMSSATTVTKVEDKDITTPFTNVMGRSANKTYYFQVTGYNSSGTALNTWGNT